VEELMTTGRRRLRLTAALATGVVLVTSGAACGDGSDGRVQVFAAASLTDVFEEVVDRFEAENPDVEVTLSFSGSSALVEQVLDGAPADVLATADERTMDGLVAAEASPARGEPRAFARNRLVLVVPAGNPGAVSELSDLADDELFVGLCAAEVPCGDLAANDVRSLLTKLTAGELDAGLVYETDARAAGDDVEVVDAPELAEATTSYPIVALGGGDDPSAGADFASFVLGAEGQAILAEAGFEAP
jgi:molybdate transport system substrate-binding protein